MYYVILGSIRGLYPLDTSITPLPGADSSKMSSEIDNYPQGAKIKNLEEQPT